MFDTRARIAIATLTARLIPLLLILVAGYITYVVVRLLSVNYLLAKKNDKVTAVSILLIYCLLSMVLIASFLRLTYTTYCDPPFVPLGKSQTREPGNSNPGGSYDDKEDNMSSGLQSFYEKSVFISDYTGKPFWCSLCANWKPDRAHHCSQTGRCIKKMDHFCPWVGGPVGESNFKFFIQFTTYGALYCTYVLIVVATITSSRQKNDGEQIETAFIITLGLASTFLLFSGGMSLHGIRLAVTNMTQVERIGAKKRVYNLAAIVPSVENLASENNILQYFGSQSFITYPLVNNIEQLTWPISSLNPSLSQRPLYLDKNQSTSDYSPLPSQLGAFSNNASEGSQTRQQPICSDLINPSSLAGVKNNDLAILNKGNPDLLEKSIRANTSQSEGPNSDSEGTLAKNCLNQTNYRTFVILRTNEGENPWDLGSSLLNWKTVMGNSIIDWILPINRSPCCNHDSPESQFEFGYVVGNLLSSLGLSSSGNLPNHETH
ncbi:Palmitoyltransferase pfa5 [Erysiphe necator]|nr:Palmitoyltransferase pfa5 [Erysiphe necator]